MASLIYWLSLRSPSIINEKWGVSRGFKATSTFGAQVYGNPEVWFCSEVLRNVRRDP